MIIRFLLSVILIGLLTACQGVAGPAPDVVKQAIALHLNQLQQELGQELRLGHQPQKFEISHVTVTQQHPLTIQDRPAVQVQGTYDLTLNLPGRQVVERQNPFEVYLQRQPEGKSWAWAQPAPPGDSEDTWITQPLP